MTVNPSNIVDLLREHFAYFRPTLTTKEDRRLAERIIDLIEAAQNNSNFEDFFDEDFK